MEQQVAIELLNLMGKQVIEFTDKLIVKMSPHSFPLTIKKIMIDNRVLIVETDESVTEFSKLNPPVRDTIGQRLRLLFYQATNSVCPC